MPLALLSIASYLDPDKYEILIIDRRLDEHAHEHVLSEIEGAIAFGVSVLTGAPIKDAVQITRKVKDLNPEIITVWGGWHPSLFPKKTLQDEKSVDITVQAQGEKTFSEIVDAISKGKPFEGIRGLTYRDHKDNFVQNPMRPMINMDELPRLNYDLVDVEAYFKKKGRRQFDYISSIGCFFRCTFCADPHVFQRKFSAYSAERMAEEIQFYYEKYNFTDLNFQDETLFTYGDRILEFAEELSKRKVNITWAGTMRADQGNRLSEEDFASLASNGLRRVLIGVESGSQEMMDWLKKDIKMEHVHLCAERCQKNGIGVIFPFIVGFPNESEDSFQKSIKMALELNRMSPLFQTPIFYFKPYPGSHITNDVVANGYQLPDTLEDWSNFDYVGSTGPWVSPEKYQFVEHFKFYNSLAKVSHKWAFPLAKLASWRLSKYNFKLPIDRKIIELIKPAQKLS